MAAREKHHDEGVDILKFFIGVMALLTVLVAGFAGYNWSKADALAEEVEASEDALEHIKRIAGNADFKRAVARAQIEKSQVDVTKADLVRFLTDAATLQRFSVRIEAKGGGLASSQQGYLEKTYAITIEKQTLEVIADYLFNIQANWPGLKIKELSIKEAPTRASESFAGWNAVVNVSIFRPKDA